MSRRAELHEKWVDAEGRRVVVSSSVPAEPSGPPVILLPSMVSSRRYLLPAAHILARMRCVFVPDLPGQGASPPAPGPATADDHETALRVLVEAAASPIVLVANSFSTRLAMEFARRRPDLVHALVLTRPVAGPKMRNIASLAKHFAKSMRREPRPYLAILFQDAVRVRPRRALANLPALLSYPVEKRAADVAVPTVVVRADHEDLVSPAFARKLAAPFPTAGTSSSARDMRCPTTLRGHWRNWEV